MDDFNASAASAASATMGGGLPTVEVKSKFDAEFRRFSLDGSAHRSFEEFRALVGRLHGLDGNGPGAADDFRISYVDSKDNDLLPINNTDNYQRALKSARPPLRLVIQRRGEVADSTVYFGKSFAAVGRTTLMDSVLGGGDKAKTAIAISQPSEFRQVSAIIDVDVVPETCRRVRLLKHGSDRPLGFYIRDGTSVRVTPAGLAEGTGLLAVNDDVLEVNGIEVMGKSLDQVTDMMVANSSNLIVTVKPANQRTLISNRGSFSRTSNLSHGSALSRGSSNAAESGDHDEEDEIRDLTTTPSAALAMARQQQMRRPTAAANF